MTLYFAYGSNLSLDQMQHRCPDAVPLAPFHLPDARLIFRGVADVVFEPGASCPGGLWRLTPACERTLDRYEGFRPDGGGMYRKLHVEHPDLPDGETHLMLYVMNSTGITPPSIRYYHVIADGYEDFGLEPSRASHRIEARTRCAAPHPCRAQARAPKRATCCDGAARAEAEAEAEAEEAEEAAAQARRRGHGIEVGRVRPCWCPTRQACREGGRASWPIGKQSDGPWAIAAE